MKRICSVFAAIVTLFSVFSFSGCGETTETFTVTIVGIDSSYDGNDFIEENNRVLKKYTVKKGALLSIPEIEPSNPNYFTEGFYANMDNSFC